MKIHLSPAATAVGLFALHAIERGAEEVVCTDADLADATGLMPDTCYRAIRELADVGAISDEPRVEGVRRLVPVQSSWVWSALVQIGESR